MADEAAPASPAIGIDLGTTYSCVAVYEHGVVEIIADDMGSRTTPSYVAFTDQGRLIGETAKNQVSMNHKNTVFDAKRLIGRRFNDETVQADMRHFPFNVINDNGKPGIEVEYKNETKRYSPEEISSMVLVRMKEIAESYLGTQVRDAVITVPAYFTNAQRQATKNAGEIAGLNVLRIINEPTAAAIAYGLEKRSKGEKNILIFDLGGGTFDVSILAIDDGVFEVKATSGDSHLGGEDFDSRMVDHFVQEFQRKHEKDISNDKKALRRLRTACEQAKRTLSSATQTSVQILALSDGVNFNGNISRAKFEDLCSDFFLSTIETVEKALMDSRMEKDDIDEIILVGGSTRIPKIQRLLQEFFGGKELNNSINPDEAVAYGAAVQAAILTGVEADLLQDLLLLDVIPLSLGIDTASGVMSTLIERNSATPTRETHYASPSHANQTNVIISVYEGERPLSKDNNLLGEFTLGGIRPAQGNDLPIVEVTFEIDANGLLNVVAEDVVTKEKNQITINNDASRLSQIEIDRMRREAEVFRQQDQKEAERLQARSNLDRYLDYLRSTSEQAGFKARISVAEQETIAQKIQEATVWFEDHVMAEKEDIEEKREELKKACQAIIERAYV